MKAVSANHTGNSNFWKCCSVFHQRKGSFLVTRAQESNPDCNRAAQLTSLSGCGSKCARVCEGDGREWGKQKERFEK